MALLFYHKELTELMENFYILTGMRIVLFDENHQELIAYPTNSDTFCNCMRKDKTFNQNCNISDRICFDECKKEQKLVIHKCHAGLTEATAPIFENDKIIGYMMFGQITNEKNKNLLQEQMKYLQQEYNITRDLNEQIRKIKYRNKKQIFAAAKILEACTSYIQLKEIVYLSQKNIVDSLEEYVDKHISEEITIEQLATEFNLSRTRLYEIMRQCGIGGIANFIKEKRLQYAKKLIQSTNMTIVQISNKAGFNDYNYFLRIFKKKFGISPKKIRMSLTQDNE